MKGGLRSFVMLNTVLPFLDCSKENSERKCVEDGTLLREEEVRVHYISLQSR